MEVFIRVVDFAAKVLTLSLKVFIEDVLSEALENEDLWVDDSDDSDNGSEDEYICNEEVPAEVDVEPSDEAENAKEAEVPNEVEYVAAVEIIEERETNIEDELSDEAEGVKDDELLDDALMPLNCRLADETDDCEKMLDEVFTKSVTILCQRCGKRKRTF